jgi:DNA-binding transcriptional MerR regulator
VIKIGDFARLSQVTVPTLRHYDEMGLLKPIKVDNFTGYRYYSVSQLPRLNRILALKDLGFSLDQIEQVLNGLTVDQLRGMLKMKQAEVEQRLTEEQARLERISARLRHIELEDTLSDYAIVLKTVPSMLVASYTVTIPTNDQVGDYLNTAYTEAYTHIHQNGAKPAGPHLAIWYQAAEVHANEVAEAAVPIDHSIPASETVKVYELRQVQVASVVHHGDFDNFTQEHTALLKWIESNGYDIAGPYREVYINHNPSDMSEAATEIQYPVQKA